MNWQRRDPVCSFFLNEINSPSCPQDIMCSIFTFRPCIDFKSQQPFMPRSPRELAAEGIDVPILIGYNSHEGILFSGGKFMLWYVSRYLQQHEVTSCTYTINISFWWRTIWRITLQYWRKLWHYCNSWGNWWNVSEDIQSWAGNTKVLLWRWADNHGGFGRVCQMLRWCTLCYGYPESPRLPVEEMFSDLLL